jgi:hypothetical protein
MGHWFAILGAFLIGGFGWLVFAVSARLIKNLYLYVVLGAAICTGALYWLDLWRARELRQTYKSDGQWIFINGKITAAGVPEVLLSVGKYAIAFALLVLIWNCYVVKRADRGS